MDRKDLPADLHQINSISGAILSNTAAVSSLYAPGFNDPAKKIHKTAAVFQHVATILSFYRLYIMKKAAELVNSAAKVINVGAKFS